MCVCVCVCAEIRVHACVMHVSRSTPVSPACLFAALRWTIPDGSWAPLRWLPEKMYSYGLTSEGCAASTLRSWLMSSQLRGTTSPVMGFSRVFEPGLNHVGEYTGAAGGLTVEVWLLKKHIGLPSFDFSTVLVALQ